MSETVAHTDDASNETSRATEIEANRIRRAVDGDVETYSTFTGDDRIIVTWNNDNIDGVCDMSKASVINNVVQSSAAVQLFSTRDGKEKIEFEPLD